jgi:hypothetical protein
VLKPGRHHRGWPRFTLAQTTASSDQSHRLYVSVQGGVDTHDARGADWEVVQWRPLREQTGDSAGSLKDPLVGGL